VIERKALWRSLAEVRLKVKAIWRLKIGLEVGFFCSGFRFLGVVQTVSTLFEEKLTKDSYYYAYYFKFAGKGIED